MKRLLGLIAIVVVTAGASAGFAVSAGAAGNSANAKACQKGGWQDLTDADGEAFKNQGDCVSYAAKGGQFGTPESPCLAPTNNPGVGDARLTGELDTQFNTTRYTSQGGTCVGPIGFFSVVTGTTQLQAIGKCGGLGWSNAVLMQLVFPTAPSDWYFCT